MRRDTPVIMTTGFSTVENAVHALYAGAIDFIPKPFTADELLSSVHRGLRYRQLRTASLPGSTGAKDAAMVVVPCPARYYRLGYASWVVVEQSGSVLVGATHAFLKTVEQVEKLEAVLAERGVDPGHLLSARAHARRTDPLPALARQRPRCGFQHRSVHESGHDGKGSVFRWMALPGHPRRYSIRAGASGAVQL